MAQKGTADSKPTRPSEVIAGALKLFMQDSAGKMRAEPAWNNFTLIDVDEDHPDENTTTYCSLGAIRQVATGSAVGDSTLASEAANIVFDAIAPSTKRLLGLDMGEMNGDTIPDWNDSLPAGRKGFRSIKTVFCRALKKAVEMETGIKVEPKKKRSKRAR